MNFLDKAIIVTGASKGLGKMLAKMLTKEGAIVIGTYYQTKIKSNYKMIKCNITKESDVKKLFETVINKFHKIDYVINCATFTEDDDFISKDFNSFMRVIKSNLGGCFLIDKYACLNMEKGTIINISSTDAVDTFSPYSMDYAASKAGIDNLTKNFALRMPNLKICALAPAWIDTETVLNMDPKFLEQEMKKHSQKELLHKENVALKIMDILINDKYQSGEIIRMERNDD